MSNEDKLKEIKLPCSVKIGNATFGKGVGIHTLIGFAQRQSQYLSDELDKNGSTKKAREQFEKILLTNKPHKR